MKYNARAIKRYKSDDLKLDALTRLVLKKNKKRNIAHEPEPISENWHRIYHDYDSWTEFGLFDCEGMSSFEINEAVKSLEIRPPFTAYDCSGKPMTIWIRWYKNPCGLVSVIHRIGLDV